MNCYYNTQHAPEIENGKLKPCTEVVEAGYLCPTHKKDHWYTNEVKRGAKLTFEQKLEAVRNMGKKRDLTQMTMAELTSVRYKLETWLLKHDQDNDLVVEYERNLSRLEKVEDEINRRPVFNTRLK